MEFGLDPALQQLKGDIDTWLDGVLAEVGETADPEHEYDSARAFSRKLAEKGWIAPSWPKEYGGMAATPLEQTVFSERFAYRRAPTTLQTIPVGFAGPTIFTYGTPEQKAQHLGGITSGATVWCQGFSEPGSGSDLASLQTRAVRDGDSYVVNGQKIWTSYGHLADWCILLCRTDPDAPKHRGISYFLLDMHSPGVTVRPLINMANRHGFNEVFLEDVRIPVSQRLGEENRGWYIATTTLDFERSSVGGTASARRLLDDAIAGIRGFEPSRRQRLRSVLADLVVACEIGHQLSYRVAWLQSAGKIPNYEASVAKLYSTELGQRIANTLVNAYGLRGNLRAEDKRAPLDGIPSEDHMRMVSMTIAGGTSEIQRNIIATRGLGLPRV
ncbi:MAG: acyl-CoA dehydrogenase family protein [Chloroflexi bacterium]|nr:acyl-CoA dehydrogenase family protein [Chloroflexota bacterium]